MSELITHTCVDDSHIGMSPSMHPVGQKKNQELADALRIKGFLL
jgi:hypothetical protein